MTTPKTNKKAAALQDWHPADVVATLRKAGWSLQQLAFHHGYTSRQAFSKALHAPYPAVERLIAGALEVKPESIWPSRYGADGLPNRSPGPKPLRPIDATPSVKTKKTASRHVTKDMPTKVVGNPQAKRAA